MYFKQKGHFLGSVIRSIKLRIKACNLFSLTNLYSSAMRATESTSKYLSGFEVIL